LAAAERLFAEQGFGGVSMPMIAKASGITAGAIYKHFDSKADLFFEIVRRTVQSVPAPAATGSASDAVLLTRIAAMYTTNELKRLRQLAIETHYASVKHPRIRRLLRQSLDRSIQQISESVAAEQQAGKLEPAADPELLASAVMVFIMGLMHMESLLPHLVGDPEWRDFVQTRVATLIGLR
jgi:AcrR family transcriptional regulator